MARGSVFQSVGTVRTGRSVFDLSYEKKFDCDMGQLIPILAEECVPGDIWNVGNEIVLRFQPLVAPILHSVHVYVHYFFVPYRLLWDDWEKFITGGEDGDFTASPPEVGTDFSPAKGTLWDFFGFPIGIVPNKRPSNFPISAYNFIWNEYYRDQNLQDPIGSDAGQDPSVHYDGNDLILNRAWTKDYFSSALPWQQRGTAPALPSSGVTSAVFEPSGLMNDFIPGTNGVLADYGVLNNVGGTPNVSGVHAMGSAGAPASSGLNDVFNSSLDSTLAANVVNQVPFDISELRLAFQIQKWLERNARAGARYTEFLKAHFPAWPRDDRLDRPEYIGGSKSPVIISEVLQTSNTADGISPQGNMAGHGISVSKNHCCKYHVQEFGIIMGIMSVMPRPSYQQGINRQWLRKTKFDYYFPEFAHLSEQAIEEMEIYTQAGAGTGPVVNSTIFGYQGRYNEMRVKYDMVCNNMRDVLDYWHLGRQFSTPPVLNSDFITVDAQQDGLKRIFADQTSPGLLVNFGNIVRAVRPMPFEPNPGLIDHF